ncbi:RhuM family protein [Desulfobacter hydrogenophilus]|uniref:RhuM family protein n=1 Tax=Desulfobacter hydrogenophilus TaxID=2291 RepID=UPI001F5EB66D|nr:RhuM family protein [Desulfobacter hydrogenophilus]
MSVGYRANSKKRTRFRIWATQRLKEYLVRGYSINQTDNKSTLPKPTNQMKRINQMA